MKNFFTLACAIALTQVFMFSKALCAEFAESESEAEPTFSTGAKFPYEGLWQHHSSRCVDKTGRVLDDQLNTSPRGTLELNSGFFKEREPVKNCTLEISGTYAVLSESPLIVRFTAKASNECDNTKQLRGRGDGYSDFTYTHKGEYLFEKKNAPCRGGEGQVELIWKPFLSS